MKIYHIKVTVPDGVQINSEEDVFLHAITSIIERVEFVSDDTRADVFPLELYSVSSNNPIYTRKEVIESGAIYIEFPDGRQFLIRFAVEPMPEKHKFKIILSKDHYMMVSHWDEDNPKPPLVDPRPGKT